MTSTDVLKLCKEQKVQFIDLRFMDFPGLWQHTTCPISELTLESFEHGFGFDGSSIRGWQAINESDMLLVPVADTAKIDPFMQHTTLSMICDVRDPITKKEYSRDPRSIARKAAAYLKKTKIADTRLFRPGTGVLHLRPGLLRPGNQLRQVLRRQPRRHLGPRRRGPHQPGYKVRLKEGYFPTPPMDTMQNIRSEMVATLIDLGIPVEAHHHEVATGGQCEIDMRFQDLVTMADNVMTVQIRLQKRRRPSRQSRHLHAQAPLPGQRLRHARPFLPVERRQAAVRRQQIRRPERNGPLRHRRHPQARPPLCAPCAIRPPTATSGWSPATKPR